MNAQIAPEELLSLTGLATPAARESFVEMARRVLDLRFRQAGIKPNEAEDLTQECLVELISNYRRFDPEKGSLESWISGFAKNAVKAWWRRELSKRNTELSYSQTPEAGLAVTEQMMEISAVKYGLSELCVVDRELLYMRFALGMSFDDIAKNTDLSSVNARKRVSRAVEKLRRDPAIRESLGF